MGRRIVLRHHRPTQRGYIFIEGKRLYLGHWPKDQHEPPLEVDRAYHAKVNEILGKQMGQMTQPPALDQIEKITEFTVVELCDRYLSWAEKEFAESRHYIVLKWCIRFIARPFGLLAVKDFTPKHLQTAMIEADKNRSRHPKREPKPLTRQGVNRIPRYIRQCFAWGVVEGLVPETVYRALTLVRPLKKGRCPYGESPKRLPVERAVVERTLEILHPMLRSMVEILLHTGMRPSELLHLRTRDVTKHKSGTWIYEVPKHKNLHLDIPRRVPIGPRGMLALTQWLNPKDPDAFVFSPKVRLDEWNAERVANRKSPRQPSQALDVRKTDNPKRPIRDRYDAASFRRAIQESIKRYNKKNPDNTISIWKPSALRKTHGQTVRDAKGREAARSILGHSKESDVTEVYANDLTLAIETQKELG